LKLSIKKFLEGRGVTGKFPAGLPFDDYAVVRRAGWTQKEMEKMERFERGAEGSRRDP